MPPSRLSPPHRPSRWLAQLLVCALLCLQALGQAHRVGHPSPVAGHGAHQHQAPLGGGASAEKAGRGWSALFGHEQQADDCRLFDQLALGDLAPDAAESCEPPRLVAAGNACIHATPGAVPCLAYQARGPPLSAS